MNTTNSGTSESSGDAGSSRGKKKKKEKRREKKLKSKKSKSKKRKRKHRSSDSESEDTRDSKTFKKCKRKKSTQDLAPSAAAAEESTAMPGPSVPRGLLAEQAKSRAPMTKEEWEKSQSVIRRVHDESTGRTRLIRGDGEILEEIVSKDRHREINKQATAGDGAYFQSKLQVDHEWQ